MNNREFFNLIFANAWHKRTSGWGWRKYTYLGQLVTDFHVGVDESTGGKSKPLYPVEYAYVTKIGKDTRSGNYVYIWCAGAEHFYCHLASIKVKVGQIINRSNIVGMAGSTGHSTGIHLHFGIKINGKWVNPDAWISNYIPTTVKTRYVNSTTGLNVRTKPSILSSKLFALVNNTEVKVYLSYNGWSWIKCAKGHGWVKSEYLSIKR